jgi:hypothetical protein
MRPVLDEFEDEDEKIEMLKVEDYLKDVQRQPELESRLDIYEGQQLLEDCKQALSVL